jgi:hypothetical protein
MYADRVRETSTTTGTGDFTFDGASTGFQTFLEAFNNGDTVVYCIEFEPNGEWEVGRGTINTGSILSRDTVLASSNNNALVDFSIGTKVGFSTFPGTDAISVHDHISLTNNPHSVTADQTGAYTSGEVDNLFLKLDTTNGPLTGDLELSKATPELKLTNTANDEYTRLVRGENDDDEFNLFTRMPYIQSAESQYPPAQSSTYVKATSLNGLFSPHYATDPNKPLTGTQTNNTWLTTAGTQRFHVDLGSAKIINRIYYENFHDNGIYTDRGVKNFTFWGSNSSSDFDDLTYENDGTWVQLTTDVSQLDIHVSADTPDPKYVNVTNETAYRYYALKIADAWGTQYLGLRRIELQIVGNLTVENTLIKSTPSIIEDERGIQTYGDENGRTVIEGQSIRFNNQGVEQFSINSSGELVFPDSYQVYFGDGNDYSIQFDGTDAVHTVTSGDFVFAGGKVGIGTASPADILTVSGSGHTKVKINSGNEFDAGFDLYESEVGKWYFDNDGSDSDKFRIRSADANNRFTILQTGNIGIGTSSPSHKLEISGGDVGIKADSQKLYFGLGDDYSIEWDGTNAVHTVDSGLFNFVDGNVALSKTTPELKLTNTTNDEYTRLVRGENDDDEFNLFTRMPFIQSEVTYYPLAQSSTYVKATSYLNSTYFPHFATDPNTSLIGGNLNNQWVSSTSPTNQRFHIDLGEAKIINKIYYENGHSTGSFTGRGIKNFTFWGSNSSSDFNDLTYTNDGTWVQLTTDVSQFEQHVAADTPDPKYVEVTNETAYRYYAVKIADNWGDSTFITLRQIELISVGNLTVENTLIKSTPSDVTNERGIQTYGDENGRTVIDGQSTRFNNQGVEQFSINSSGELVFPDDYEVFFGDGNDASIQWNNDDGRLEIYANGSVIRQTNDSLQFRDGSSTISAIGMSSTGSGRLVGQNNISNQISAIMYGADVTGSLGDHGLLSENGNGLILNSISSNIGFYCGNSDYSDSAYQMLLDTSGLYLQQDDYPIYFGASQDVSIQYNSLNDTLEFGNNGGIVSFDGSQLLIDNSGGVPTLLVDAGASGRAFVSIQSENGSHDARFQIGDNSDYYGGRAALNCSTGDGLILMTDGATHSGGNGDFQILLGGWTTSATRRVFANKNYWWWTADDYEVYFGAGYDAYQRWNNSGGYFETYSAGSSLQQRSNLLEFTHTGPVFSVDATNGNGTSIIKAQNAQGYSGGFATYGLYSSITGLQNKTLIYHFGNGLVINPQNTSLGITFENSGFTEANFKVLADVNSWKFQQDNYPVYFGADDDASISWTGSIFQFDAASDEAQLTAQPTGGTDLAIATTKYVASSIVAIAEISSNTSLTTDNTVVLCDASGGSFTVSLPTSIVGKKFVIKKVDSTGNPVIVDGDGTETIDGDLTKEISDQWTVLHIVGNGSNWFII